MRLDQVSATVGPCQPAMPSAAPTLPAPATGAQRTSAAATRPTLAGHELFEVWDARIAGEREAWEAAWAEAAAGDIFSHPAYLLQFAGPGEIPRCAFFTSSSGEHVLYAFLMRPIEITACGQGVAAGLWDIYTALLYGGPLSNAAGASTVAAFWSAFRAWAQRSQVVSEFIRMSPVPERRLGYPGIVVEQAPHIVRELATAASEDELRMDMASNVRRGVKKAREAGVEITVDETGACLDEFLGIYYRTMDRTGAAAKFYFPREAFETIHATFPGRFAYVYASHEGTAVSVELILMSDATGYFFLGGTADEALRLYSNVLVHYEAILYARARGLKDYVLTGGVTNTVEDSLLRFKRMFAPRGSALYLTGQQIFDAEQYRRLACSTDAGKDGDADASAAAEETSYFPAYRTPEGCSGCTAHPAEIQPRSHGVSETADRMRGTAAN